MLFSKGPKWDSEADVIVVGSGAAGLTAAIHAHDLGAKVIVLESTEYAGGTTAVSGGGIWIPLNSRMKKRGFQDSREAALRYCRALSQGRAADGLIETFVDNAARMIDYLEARTPLQFNALTAPDYHPEVAGASQGGRSVEPAPFDTNLLGSTKSRLRPPSVLSFPATLQEAFEDYQAFYRPWDIPQDVVVERMSSGLVTLGQALAAGLLQAVLDRGIQISYSYRAQQLIRTDGGAVVGVRVAHKGGESLLRARRGVILASGGFEWNEALRRKFIGGPSISPNSPPSNQGDGLVMAMEIGADLANMNELWHYPSISIPGETYDSKPLMRAIKAERSGPHIIWVNGAGERFVNEAANYNSVGRLFFAMGTDGPTFENMPAWAVFDQQYRERYVVGTTMPEDPDPAYLIRANSPEELARLTGIDPQGLARTVARWNGFVRAGHDEDFHKGESYFDRFQGDRKAAHPNLGALEKPPYYALPLHAGALGTKGGPRTDQSARVLDVRGAPIAGLYAAGNVAASICGPSYYGVGSTLGPAMTWGFLAGEHAARTGGGR